ncbi:MAG: AEC family transporter [Lachnospiraceae bacterium]|nr:AEC family transporter [Lachnospiraceae bacterium]
MFETTLWKVIGMLFTMIPGYLVMKLKIAKEFDLKALSTNLLYVATPFMLISAFLKMEFSWETLGLMGLFFVISFLLQAAMLAAVFFLIRKRHNDTDHRVLCTESALGNVGYFGMPIAVALFPDQPIAAAFATIMCLGMSILAFTFGEYAVTNNTKFISLKQVFLNPTSIGLYIALVLYVLHGNRWMPKTLSDACASFSNMTAPLSMSILGMRLASESFGEIFKNKLVYMIMLLKLIIFPLFGFAVSYFLPLPYHFKACMVVMCATPVAAVCLSMSEKHDSGQKLAANGLLLSTIASVVTIPLLTLLLPLFQY